MPSAPPPDTPGADTLFPLPGTPSLSATSQAFRGYRLILLVGWTLLVAVASLLEVVIERRANIDTLEHELGFFLDQEMNLRRWVAHQGGVYLPRDQVRANPLLQDLPQRDVTLADGRQLTLLNTAAIIRGINELAEKSGEAPQIRTLMSSKQPLNPDNQVRYSWQQRALDAFVAGKSRYREVLEEDGRNFLTISRPLYALPSCMKCHPPVAAGKHQLLGALSIKHDLDTEHAVPANLPGKIIVHLLLWLGGILLIEGGYRRLRQQISREDSLLHHLQENRQLLATIGDLSAEWQFWLTPDGRFRYLSPTCEQITGYSPGEFYANAHLLRELVHPDDRQLYDEHLGEALRSCRVAQNGKACCPNRQDRVEFRLIDRQGGVHHIEHYCRSLDDPASGRCLGVAGVNRDVTQQRERDAMMFHQAQLAAMGEMVGNIAHQWRQPINAIGLILQNLQLDYRDNLLTPASVDEATSRSMELIQLMSTTIDDFRSFFSPDKERSHFVLEQVVRSAGNVLRDSLRIHNIVLHEELPAGIHLSGYPHELSQVILNLLSNAKDVLLERRPASPCISVRIEADAAQARIIVRDNGGGISVEPPERVLEPYFTTKPNGTGIGLYMSARIAEHMQGRIDVRNTAEGAEFIVSLPRQWSDTETPAMPPLPPR